jgi:hypothetical protein
MTMTENPPLSLPSHNVSWEDLPPSEAFSDDKLEPAKLTPDTPGKTEVPTGHCEACGELIVRAPGARGRAPKFHPDCRPLKTASSSSGTGSRRNNKAESEADLCIVEFKKLVVKGAMMLAIVDRYDAFCVMAMLPGVCDNLRAVLIRYDGMRREMLALQTGGSIVGLVITVLMGVLPMAAHHKLIPSKHVSEMLVNLPFTLVKLSQQLKDGEAKLTAMMQEQLERQEEMKRNQRASSANAHPTT